MTFCLHVTEAGTYAVAVRHEVNGIGEGLWVWFGIDYRQAQMLMTQYPAPVSRLIRFGRNSGMRYGVCPCTTM